MRTGTRLLTLDPVPLLESLGTLIRVEQVTINFCSLPAVLCDSRAHLALIPSLNSSKSVLKELMPPEGLPPGITSPGKPSLPLP